MYWFEFGLGMLHQNVQNNLLNNFLLKKLCFHNNSTLRTRINLKIGYYSAMSLEVLWLMTYEFISVDELT